ncbi:ankyrin [Acephala macrosclerotiorum]|nr:ankyrin [Acephala macrosclerotiorum]
MAEVLAIVASGAGLASLAIQLADGIDRLRKRCENLEKLRDNIGTLIEDLEIIAEQLHNLEVDHIEILEFMVVPTALGRCQAGCENVIRRLETLIAGMPSTSSGGSKTRILRTLFKSKKWKIEFDELRSVVHGLQLNFIGIQCFHQRAFMQKHMLSVSTPKDERLGKNSTSSTEASATNLEVDKNYSQLMLETVSNEPFWRSRRQRLQCAVLECYCSCHLTKQISSRFWYIRYSPLAHMLENCDTATCTARRHRLQFRAALSQLGIPWAVILGVNLTLEVGKFTLGTALQLQRVVKYTSPGFEILWKLSEEELGWDDAGAQFRELYRMDPTFRSQVDPSGRGYLEKAMEALGWASDGSNNFDNLLRVLQLFIKEFNMSLGLESSEFLYASASHNSEGCHLHVLENVLEIGYDFDNSPTPQFESWPRPCVDDLGGEFSMSIIPRDPFFIEYLSGIVRTNQDFGGTAPLHQAIWHGSMKAVRKLIQKSHPLEDNVNFLGQTPLHIAIHRPSRLKALLDAGHDINVRDKNGITPLMYAAATNRPIAVSILIRRGADLFVRDYLKNFDFIAYAAVRNHWFLIWNAVGVIESRDPTLLVSAFSRIISASKPPLFLEEGKTWIKLFMMSVLSKLGNFNVQFEDGRTMMHVVDLPQYAHLIIEHGFTALNEQDKEGEHSLFAVTKFLDVELAQRLIEKGANINLKNHKGHSVLCQFLKKLTAPREKESKKILEYLDMLLRNGADVVSTDNCSCAYTSGGCLPISRLSFELETVFGSRINNPCWVFEWLYLLEDRGKLVEAKTNALSVLRRAKFDQTNLVHTCCCCCFGASRDHTLSDDRFWDIPSVIKLDRLDDEMKFWETKGYDEIISELIVQLGKQFTEASGSISREIQAEQPFQNETVKDADTPRYEIDYTNDEFHSSIDLLLRSFKTPGFLRELGLLEIERDNRKECFVEYVSCLESARNGDLSGRMVLLTRLSSALNLPFGRQVLSGGF